VTLHHNETVLITYGQDGDVMRSGETECVCCAAGDLRRQVEHLLNNLDVAPSTLRFWRLADIRLADVWTVEYRLEGVDAPPPPGGE